LEQKDEEKSLFREMAQVSMRNQAIANAGTAAQHGFCM